VTRRTHRSFVSYIDKSREYYASQGYEHPYRWAVAEDLSFSKPTKPLRESRVGIVTTTFFPPGEEPAGVPPMTGEGPARVKHAYAAPTATAAKATFNRDLFWAKDETHTDDINTYLPVDRLAEAVDAGRIGSASPRFYGVPTGYSQRATVENDAPSIEGWMREDAMDLALLVGL